MNFHVKSLLAATVAAVSFAAMAADPNKILRVATTRLLSWQDSLQ